jgi:pyruvate dehydrogenase E2 component (dihydrolipoamide acetyltransferase)
MASEIKLPKLKENVESVEIVEILAPSNQVVAKDQPLMVVNADKSSMEVQAPMAGRIVQWRVKPGDELRIGDVYCLIESTNGEPATAPTAAATPTDKGRKGHQGQQGPTPRPDGAPSARPAAPPERLPSAVVHRAPAAQASAVPAIPEGGVIPASPAVRWLARKLGVDLRQIRGSGPHGRITEEDVKNYFSGTPGSGPGAGIAVPPLPNFEDFGEVQRQPLTRVRKLTAQKMSLAWALIPHVTQHDQADITDLEAFRKQQEARGLKLTVTAFVLKACASALAQFPTFNATLDLAGGQLILKRYYHIGVAVDTKNGLLVPVIRDVDRKNLETLARELSEVAEQARAGKADMTGASFTITNLGGIGGTAFTPIINYPEVAILGLSRSRLQPVVREGSIMPRLMLPLSLSYDHRVIDGADAARFTRRIAEMLENPWMML